MACPAFSDPGNVNSVGWYCCSSYDCENHWDKFLIAHVKNMRETIADNPNFEVYINGTLVIKEVLPMDDGKMFICIAKEKFIGKKRFTTILHIAEGNIYIVLYHDDNRNNFFLAKGILTSL